MSDTLHYKVTNTVDNKTSKEAAVLLSLDQIKMSRGFSCLARRRWNERLMIDLLFKCLILGMITIAMMSLTTVGHGEAHQWHC